MIALADSGFVIGVYVIEDEYHADCVAAYEQ